MTPQWDELVIDPYELQANYRHLIAATIVLAWMDSVGHLESTFKTRHNKVGLVRIAQDWIKGDIECDDVPGGRYKKWMELLDLCPDLEPEALAEDYAGAMKGWWEE